MRPIDPNISLYLPFKSLLSMLILTFKIFASIILLWIVFLLLGGLFIDLCTFFSPNSSNELPAHRQSLSIGQRPTTNTTHTTGRLSGRKYVLSIFVSDTEHPWDDTGIRQALSLLYAAENWLKSEACRYGAQVGFDNGYNQVNFPINDKKGRCRVSYRRRTNPQVADQIVRQLGYQDIGNALWNLKHTQHCSDVLLLFFLNQPGRSFAQGDVPTAFLYSLHNNRERTPMMSGTIAHEILHLFGAWDLYHRTGYTQEAKTALSLFPHSIMIDSWQELDALELDTLTAWRVGIAPQREPWFPWFDPDIPKLACISE